MVVWGGVTGVIAKSVEMGGMALAAYRTTVGAVVLVTALLVTGRRVTWADVRTDVPGGVFLGLDLVFFFSAVKLYDGRQRHRDRRAAARVVILISAPLLKEKVAEVLRNMGARGPRGNSPGDFGRRGTAGVERRRRRPGRPHTAGVDGLLRRLPHGPRAHGRPRVLDDHRDRRLARGLAGRGLPAGRVVARLGVVVWILGLRVVPASAAISS